MTDVSPSRDRRLFVGGERLRVTVDAPPSGGGDKFEPQTAAEARDLLLPMVRAVVEGASGLPPELRGERVYFEARLLPNYLAASHFPDVLLSRIGAVPVGSRADIGTYSTKSKAKETGTRRLILTADDEGLRLLAALIDRPGASRSEQQAFAEIRKLDRLSIADREEVILARPEDPETQITWEAVLHPSSTVHGEAEPLDEATMEKWFALVGRLGGRSHRDFVRQVGGLTFAPVVLAASRADELARFNPLRALRPMPTIRPRPRFGTRSVGRLAPPPSLLPAAQKPLVAVFDGGLREQVGGSKFFPGPDIDLTSEAADDDDLDHGTGVAGAVMYGLARPGDNARQPPCPVESLRVLPAPNIPDDLDGYWVLDQIKQAVVDKGYQIVNLSLGPALAVEDSTEPNRWTSELDQLAWERDVLFVVAAGNEGEQDRDLGLHRVQVPGDMVNGITVGACDFAPPDTPWGRVAYSSMGPGRHGNRIQPAGVQFGGTDGNQFPLLRVDGTFLDASGTSFSAPLVTHALADLATRLPVANPSVLRAFAVHYTERHRTYRKLVDEVGHGRFLLDFAQILDSGPDEAHVLFVDEIERGELIGYQLPVPTGSTGPLAITITLAYVSPVEPSQPTEYTRASLEMAVRPHQHQHRFSPPKGSTGMKPTTLDYTSPESFELLKAGWDISQEPVTKTLGAAPGSSEAQLRDAGKWETVRHYRLKLGAGETEMPRVELSYLARRAGLLDGSPSSVPFALVVSIVDASGNADFNDRVAAQFPTLTPLPRSQARIRGLQARARR
jgi:subtilisin family serine protease